MTTAHRPTFNSAIGHEDQGANKLYGGTKKTSARDQPGHLTLKTRQTGQNTKGDLSERDLRTELEERERKAVEKKEREREDRKRAEKVIESERERGRLLIEGKEGGSKPRNIDADDEDEEPTRPADDKDDSDKEDDADDDDEEAELLRELERIKRERAEETARKEMERKIKEAKEKEAAVMTGNPLLQSALNDAPVSFGIKKRWDEDVVFKNQARMEPTTKKQRFINDTVRNDFHRRFLAKYVP
eukprot:tig00021281_g19912.t1